MKNNQLVTVFRLAVYVNVRTGTTGVVFHAMMLCSVSSLGCVSPDWCRHHHSSCVHSPLRQLQQRSRSQCSGTVLCCSCRPYPPPPYYVATDYMYV